MPTQKSARFRRSFVCVLLFVGMLPAQTACQRQGGDQARDLEISVPTEDPNVTLAGTLSLPRGNGPYPAVLFLTGSGGHTRDQVISGTPMFKVLGEYLVGRGLAVLRLDDRGVGGSTGPNVRASTLDERTADAMAGLRYLLERPEIDPESVGLLGHSEGAMNAPRLAIDEPRVRFLVLLSPPSVSGAEIWVRQQIDMLRREGEMSENQMQLIERALTLMVRHIGLEGNTDDGFYRYGREACLAWGDPPEEVTPEFVTDAFGDLRQNWYRQFFASEPQAALRQLRQPVLAVFGGADQQVTLDQNLRTFVESLGQAGNQSFTVSVLPDEDHFFLRAEGMAPNEHVHGQMKVSEAALQVVGDWILLQIGKNQRASPARR
jgi:pimeloyl-ACP methyl ester carboxylesterase